ncbi:MAG: hypothetical protein PWQ37_1437 [Candidatus Petromonas sp.]|jgi:molybdopterin converting factor small subunit|nr:hypothetical protein [Candidatus Petromonas sp.]
MSLGGEGMDIEVRLFATLRKGRWKKNIISYSHEVTPRDIINDINIKEEEVAILLINGRSEELDTKLNDGDIVSIFPPVGGG